MDDRPLDLRQLEAFAAVMSTGSITGAAALLGRSQPAVTRQIQELESELGFELLYRHGPRITPTDLGYSFHVEVERQLQVLRHLRERAEAIRQGEARAIEIATIPALAAGIVPAALAGLAPQALPRRIRLRSAPTDQVVEAVLDRTADLGIASLPIEHPGLDLHWVAESNCVAVLRADDALAAKPVVPLAALASRRLIAVALPYRLRRHIDAALNRVHVSPAAVLDTNTSIEAMGAVRAGLGIAVVEPAIPASVPLDGLAVRPLDIAIPFFWGVFTPVGSPVPPAIQGLIAALRTAVRAAIPEIRLDEKPSRTLRLNALHGVAANTTEAP